MTTDMKLKMLKSMTDEEDKDVLSTYLSLAEKVVLQRAYPYENVSEVPMKYDAVHVEIAAYMINKATVRTECPVPMRTEISHLLSLEQLHQ